MKHKRSVALVLGTAAAYALWEMTAHRFLMFLPMPIWHWVSGAVGISLALIITTVSTCTILRQERKLEALARLKDDLTQMIVHDLRTPLTAMIGSLQTVKDGVVGEVPADAREMMEIALDGSRSLLRMVNDLLDIAKMEAGESILDLAEADVAMIGDEAIRVVAPLADAHGVHLAILVEPGIPRVLVDREKVERMIVNLVGNAVKFTRPGGKVELRVTWVEARRRLLVAVADTGEGIPPQYREKIFDKFGQVETRKAGRKMSTGLGLTFCKLIAEAHGGSIGVESEVGKGSTFTVELPAVEASLDKAAPPHAQTGSGSAVASQTVLAGPGRNC